MTIETEVAVDKITFHVKAWKGKNGRRHVRLWTPGTFPAIDLTESDALFKYLWGRLHSSWKKGAHPRKKAQTLPKKKSQHP
jgi:hypothetical protein